MRSVRAFYLAYFAAFGCGGEGKPGGSDPDGRVLASGDFYFLTSALEVPPCRTVTLNWNAPDADVVNIESGGVTLIATYDQVGALVSPPICETATFELTARGAKGTRVEAITVTAAWLEAEIRSFTADPQALVVQDSVNLAWQVEHPARIVLTRNDKVLLDHTLAAEEVTGLWRPRAAHLTTIDTATTAFVLTAFNPISTVSMELTVVARSISVLRFSITPPAAFESSRIVVTWEAEGTRTELVANGQRVSDFPGTLTGTFEMLASLGTSFELYAHLELPTGTRSTNVYLPFDIPYGETEPNDNLFQVVYLSTGGISGDISPADDVDIFGGIFGRPLRIWTTPRTGTTCTLFPTITVYDFLGVELGRATGSTSAEGSMCTVIDADLHPFLEEIMPGFSYLMAVSGDGVQTGEYVLFVETNAASF